MVTMEEVGRIASALPETTESDRRGNLVWSVRGKVFAWERPFTKADIRRYGEQTPPSGPILAVRVADLHDKEAVLASASSAVFTIPHFDGFAAVLIQLDAVSETELRPLLLDAWLSRAPTSLAEEHLAGGGNR